MRTTQLKGDTAKAHAIHQFTRRGYDVAVLLTESAPYDLIIDMPDGLKRVQVKFSNNKYVDLRCIHSNASGYVVKMYAQNAFDWLYVLHHDQAYLITTLSSHRSVTLQDEQKIETILDR